MHFKEFIKLPLGRCFTFSTATKNLYKNILTKCSNFPEFVNTIHTAMSGFSVLIFILFIVLSYDDVMLILCDTFFPSVLSGQISKHIQLLQRCETFCYGPKYV